MNKSVTIVCFMLFLTGCNLFENKEKKAIVGINVWNHITKKESVN